ncbi:MAG: NAD-binding oxidoreductase, partial [Clostridiales bacterium]|nr:NAD-binding oxidoreductase [Clostridiales bacterium]
MYVIKLYKKISENVFLTDVHAPRVADKCLLGQFVIVRTDKNGERIPLTICDYSRENGTVRLVVQIIGATTLKMSRLSVGDCL